MLYVHRVGSQFSTAHDPCANVILLNGQCSLNGLCMPGVPDQTALHRWIVTRLSLLVPCMHAQVHRLHHKVTTGVHLAASKMSLAHSMPICADHRCLPGRRCTPLLCRVFGGHAAALCIPRCQSSCNVAMPHMPSRTSRTPARIPPNHQP